MNSNLFHLKTSLLLAFLWVLSSHSAAQQNHHPDLPAPKNVIVFVSDGMGFNHVKAVNYYEHGHEKAQVYQQDDWVGLAMATYSSVISTQDGDSIYSAGYNPREASQNPEYIKNDYTDSGAAGTALSTGKKTYNGSIGIGIYGDSLTHMSQSAKALGKATGVVSSVQLSHATPASFVAHNNQRNNYKEIAKYMLFSSATDVIMGTGNPGFNDDSEPEEMSYRFVGNQEIWEQLQANDGRTIFETQAGTYQVQDANGNGQPDPWTLIQTREEFQQLTEGETPGRVIGVPQVHSTLQQSRSEVSGHTMPFETPFIESVPTLAEMTRAAIHVLSQNTNGFFVMVEGGAVDWASHNNDSARMIEEQMDFNNSVEAAVEWVETYSSWDETLIIVTSDHECGYLTGPGDPDPIYQPVTNNGQGELPGMQWHFGSHTNTLVPFYAKGPGTDFFELKADKHDPIFGPFIENTDIANLIFMMWGKP